MNQESESWSKMTKAEKLYVANNIYVSYPRSKEILAAIDDCYQLSDLKSEPECLFLKGVTGTGKSTLIKSYANDYPRQQTPSGTEIPVLSVTIPSPATVKSLVTKLLWELGDPAFSRGTIGIQTIRLIGLLKDCGIRLIFLDEFQHFIDRDSDKVLKTISDWLKNIILDSKVSIVLIGLPDSEAVFDVNPQLSRRFANRYNLSPFDWAADEGKEFRTFLHAIESQLPLKEKSNLSSLEMAWRFYYASDGVVAYVMKLIRYGTHLALNQEREKLELAVLAAAFDRYVLADKPSKINPFLTDDVLKGLENSAIRFHQQNHQTLGTNRRLKSQPRTVKASELLRK